MSEKLCPGKEAFLKSARDVGDEEFRTIVATRARRVLGRRVAHPASDDERRGLEKALKKHFEKIHRGADFLPARFLASGAERARAVCRIETNSSFGTGALIAPGILITNNHVIESRDEASQSVARFDFGEDQESFTVPIEPERLFLTDVALDFTIVACGTTGLEDILPIALRRTPAGVTRHERVSIVQHPAGRLKEVALHDNRVTRVLDRVVRYRTDTEPGSSGSPVFNNEWELVALHHAGVKHGDEAENEGILISAIVDHLLRTDVESLPHGRELARLLPPHRGSSPFLGFFDSVGLDSSGQEVVVGTFRGTQQFADIGFWNIEHFRDSVSNRRVRDVAEVLTTLNMDVMGLTEVQGGALDRLVDELSARGIAADFVLENVAGSQDIAVLFDSATTRVRHRDDLNRRHRDRLDRETPQGRSAFPRDPLFAECTVDPDGPNPVRFLMIVVHLKAFGDAQSRARRRLASEMLGQIIADIRDDEELPVVLGGDFNELLANDVLSPLHDSPDMFALTADDATGTDPDAISFVGDRHRSLIDHIVVSTDVALGEIQGDDAAIVRLDRSVAGFADRVSDHVPVVVRLVMREQPADIDPTDSATEHEIPIPHGADRLRVEFIDEQSDDEEERRERNGRGKNRRRSRRRGSRVDA